MPNTEIRQPKFNTFKGLIGTNDCALEVVQHLFLPASNSPVKSLKADYETTFSGTQQNCFNDQLLLLYIYDRLDVTEAGDTYMHIDQQELHSS